MWTYIVLLFTRLILHGKKESIFLVVYLNDETHLHQNCIAFPYVFIMPNKFHDLLTATKLTASHPLTISKS